MTRDYAKKSTKRGTQHSPRRKNTKRQPVKKSGTQAPGWLWLFAGILLGVLIMSLTRLSDIPSPENAQVTDDNSANSSDDDGQKPRFDFYTLLRESEVIVPDTPASSGNTAQTTKSDDIFLLQVGSFKNSRDADSLRARLLLLNLDAHVEKVSPRKNETWHRVIVGPFGDRSHLADARSRLASNGIDSLLLKRKK
jgi:hypothetical protein